MSRKKKPPRSPVQARSRETVRAIVDAATRIVKEEGRAAVTAARVAKVAGVSPGTLYEYFSSVDAILGSVEERTWVEQVHMLDAVMAGMSGRPTAENVRTLVEAAMTYIAAGSRHRSVAGGDPGTLETRLELIEVFVAAADARLGPDKMRRTERRLALTIAVKAVTTMTWLGMRDHPEAMASGVYQAEIVDLIVRYLLADPPG